MNPASFVSDSHDGRRLDDVSARGAGRIELLLYDLAHVQGSESPIARAMADFITAELDVVRRQMAAD